MDNSSTIRAARMGREVRRGLLTVARLIGWTFFLLFTLALIGVCTTGIFAKIFLTYVDTSLRPTLAVNLDDYTMDQTSIIYYHDNTVEENGGWVEDQRLHGQENRIVVPYSEIPKAMVQATVAIEDERFYEHQGVDWRRTAGAVVNTLVGNRAVFGGSTITQQVLKNITEDNDPYINRKIREIFRALEFEKDHSKEEIMELYLNTIYFGKGCYGVQTAAQYYFGKDCRDLTVAECACLIAITNNPSRYGPMYNITIRLENADGTITETTPREENKRRQELILWQMYSPDVGLCYLTESQYLAAKAEELQFIERTGTAAELAAAQAAAEGKSQYNSWFVDQVIREVSADLAAAMNIEQDSALKLLYRMGYRIYTTMDPKVQAIADAVYLDRSNLDITSRDGQQIRSAITIMDPSTGNIVAICGDIGPKEGNLVWSFASDPHQVGSSIKPLTCYAPALEVGVITPATALDDYPVMKLEGSAWPKNTPAGYAGMTTVKNGVRVSKNTIAVRTLQLLGIENSFAFATEKLHLNLISNEQDAAHNDMALSPLAMGGLTRGLTTIEMAGAYGAIANSGVYNKPKTYLRVEDSQGRIVLDNTGPGETVMRETTAWFMTDMLVTAIESGNASPAKFDGMHIAGKTGTTTDNFDRYFVGYTPYYVASVWTGFKSNAQINYSGNPAVTMWKKVMEQIHAGLEDKPFEKPENDIVTVQVCQDSGLLATSACRNEVRGNRTITVEMEAGTEPTETCGIHVFRKWCRAGHCIATRNCPRSSTTSVGLMQLERKSYSGVYASDAAYTTSGVRTTCSVHYSGWSRPKTETSANTGGGSGGTSSGGGSSSGGSSSGGEASAPAPAPEPTPEPAPAPEPAPDTSFFPLEEPGNGI